MPCISFCFRDLASPPPPGMSLSLPLPRISLPGGAVASVDEVVVLITLHGGRCHTFPVVIVRRQVRHRRCRLRGMSSSSSPPQLSLPGGASATVMLTPKIAFLWPCARPPKTALAGGRVLTVVFSGGGAAIIYLVARIHCMYLDCNGPSPAKKQVCPVQQSLQWSQ